MLFAIRDGAPGGDHGDQRAALSRAIERLPAPQWAVLRRAYFLRMSTTQIADELDIAESAVMRWMHEGLHSLHVAMGESCATP